MADDGSAVQRLASLSEEQRRKAMERFAVLRPHLEDGVPLLRAARDAGIPFRTAQRWLARHRQDGLVGLARSTRNDAGKHRLPSQFVALVEGLALKRPRSATAAIHRRVAEIANTQGSLDRIFQERCLHFTTTVTNHIARNAASLGVKPISLSIGNLWESGLDGESHMNRAATTENPYETRMCASPATGCLRSSAFTANGNNQAIYPHEVTQ
jgi:hypothetical protein